MAKVAEKYPLCAGRGVLYRYCELAGRESRVNFSTLLMSFTQVERARWDRDSREYPRDEFGMMPEAVERFLQTLIDEGVSSPTLTTLEAQEMAKKKAAKSATPAAATAMKDAGDPTKNDPAQPPLPGMEDERIPAIERAVKKVLDKRKEAKAAKEEADAELARLPGLLQKHERQNYKCLGKIVVIEPGADIVKIKKVKDK